MAGPFPHPRAARPGASWPRDLHRAAILLGAGSALYWSSFALGPVDLWVPSLGRVYGDLLLAWVAVLLSVAAWPPLRRGLRDLRARRPRDASPVLAWRAFLLSLGLLLSAVVLVPLEYHTLAATDSWLLVYFVTAFPYLAWTFVPMLALHGIVFGRAAGYLDSRAKRLTDAGALVLFAVALASTAVIFGHPDATVFVRSWTVGRGLLPAAAFLGYALVAVGLTLHVVPSGTRVPRAALQGAR